MENILTIEIKDNKTIMTLDKVSNEFHNILMHKIYNSKPLAGNTLYDVTIVEEIKKDLKKINMLDNIDEILLSINTKRVIIETYKKEFKFNTNVNFEKENIKRNLEEKHPTLEITKIMFSDVDVSLTKKNVDVTVEYVEKDFINKIKRQFNNMGLKITKLIPAIQTITNSTKNILKPNLITLSILVEEKFTQLVIIDGGTVKYSVKWEMGLSKIYDHISSMMDIDKKSAKGLFKSFGSIPPEDVKDNKIIFKNEKNDNQIFTKKDLSKFITEKVNELFSNVKSKIDPLKLNKKNIQIIFNGEIKSLIGFKKYATNSFAEPNIVEFNSDIIGLNEETEFITFGILREISSKNSKIKSKEINNPKINVINKIWRMYNYI